MNHGIKIITLPLPLHMGSVNCYLLEATSGYFLVDTGSARSRKELSVELENAGCLPGSGNLRLILLTHGDFDHTGNAAFLRERYGVHVAMHCDDAGMVERADMSFNRKKPNRLIASIVPLFMDFRKEERFTPDILLRGEENLQEHGLEARVLSLPGHSMGSISILTTKCDLFCGDLFENTHRPALNSLIDDAAAAQTSLSRLAALDVESVYPGHGKPFTWQQFTHMHPVK